MKKNNSINSTLIIELLVFIGWCVSVVLFTNFKYVGFNFWCAFSGTVFAFLATGISLITVKQSQNANDTEVSFIPIIISIIYLLGAVIFNGIFIFGMYVFLSRTLVIFNIIWFVMLVGGRLSADNYLNRVEMQTEKISAGVSNVGNISTSISMIVSKATEPELKKELLKLKESVDYSSNISQSYTVEFENQMLDELDEINAMLDGNFSNEEIIAKIRSTGKLWKTRNSMNSTIR